MANFLEHRALKRAAKALAGSLREGEHLVEFDICNDPMAGDQRVEAVVSNLAIYLVRPGLVSRIPLTDISWAHEWAFGSGMCVQTRQGGEVQLGHKGQPRGLFGALEDQLHALGSFVGELTPDPKMPLTYRAEFPPSRHDQIGHWLVTDEDGKPTPNNAPQAGGLGTADALILGLQDQVHSSLARARNGLRVIAREPCPPALDAEEPWSERNHDRLATSALRSLSDLTEDFDWTTGAVVTPTSAGTDVMPCLFVVSDRDLTIVTTPESRGWAQSMASVATGRHPIGEIGRSSRMSASPDGSWAMSLEFITPDGRTMDRDRAIESGELTSLILGIDAGNRGETVWRKLENPPRTY